MHRTTEPRATPTDGAGELVIENGPQSGFRRALVGPLTFIGRAEWCDLRVDAPAVSLWHCVLARSVAGLVLRDLHSNAGTLVNGLVVTSCTLHDGDLVSVGPVQFSVRWKEAPSTSLTDLERERSTLQTQAVVLAARQAALDQSEQQLAAETEAKQQELQELAARIRRERDALLHDREAYEERVSQVQQDLARDRLAMTDQQKELREQMERVEEARLRQKRLWDTQRAEELSQLAAREAAVSAAEQTLEQTRVEFHQERLRFNGEIELGRRELQAAWAGFRQEQEAQQVRLAQRERALHDRLEALARREQALADAERERTRQTRHWEKQRALRQAELDGLENRVLNQRQKVLDLERSAARLPAWSAGKLPTVSPANPLETHLPAPTAVQATPPAQLLPGVEAELAEHLHTLEALADELADQRLHLVEQCEWLSQARHEWQQEREAVTAELEIVGTRLSTREQAVREQEQVLLMLEQEIQAKAATVDRARNQLEAERARLSAQSSAWQAEREHLLAKVRELDEQVNAREHAPTGASPESTRLRQRLEHLTLQCERYDRQVQTLQDEVEHLARLLMEEPVLPLHRLEQAA